MGHQCDCGAEAAGTVEDAEPKEVGWGGAACYVFPCERMCECCGVRLGVREGNE